VGSAISNAASTVGNFVQQNAVPIIGALGGAAAIGLGAGLASSLGGSSSAQGPSFESILGNLNLSNLSPQEQLLLGNLLESGGGGLLTTISPNSPIVLPSTGSNVYPIPSFNPQYSVRTM